MTPELDLEGVPTTFLDAYPFPAFVLAVSAVQKSRPRLASRDTDITVRRYEDVSPLSGPSGSLTPRKSVPLVWSNERWLAISRGQSLDECLDWDVQEDLQRWAEGYSDDIFRLDIESTTLTLAKTIVPLSPPSLTHAYCVVTCQQDEPAPTPPPPDSNRSSFSTDDYSYFDHRVSQSSEVLTSISEAGPSEIPHAGPLTRAKNSDRKLRTKRSMRQSSGPIPMTSERMSVAAKECWALLESIDWSKTSVGPRSQWAAVVDPILSVAFMSNTQDCVWLGRDVHLIYNKNYSEIVDHPWAFGRKGKEVWVPLWDYIEPMLEQCFQGTAIYKDNDYLAYEPFGPDGVLKEKYHTWRYIPIRTHDGTVIGVWNQALDTTSQVLAERRLGTVRELSDHMLIARTKKEYYQSIADVLEQNPKDAPFAMVYSVEQTKADHLVSHLDLTLQSSAGVPTNHPSAPAKLSVSIPVKHRAAFGVNADRLSSPTLSAISALSSGSNRLYQAAEGQWPIVKALSSRQCVIVEDISDLIRGFPIRQYDHLPTSAIVVPICSDASIELPEAVLIVGLNYRRPFDEDYDSWIHVIRSQLASSLTSVKAHEEEQKRIEGAARMENAKAAWFRGAAHDLRSPLTLISGPIDDLLDTNMSATQKQSLQTAKRNVDRLLRLVNTLMDFSRLEAGRVEGRFVPTDLGAFVSELAQVFRPAVERAKISFHVQIEPNDRLVYLDPTLFETVLSNLIGNALKYTESGSITVKLAYGDFADVSVIDTGVGIPKDEVDSVAEWYHRATTAIHAGTQGTGLGLALARELLLLHGGELVVTSQTAAESIDGSHGSVFMARIPLTAKEVSTHEIAPIGQYGTAVANEAMRWTRDSDSETASDANSESLTTGSSRISDGLMFSKNDVILLVDDNLDMREYIKQIFSGFCKVIEASDGEQGLAKAIESKPDLIISDLMMAKMNGLDFLNAVRSDSRTKIIPFIMMSAVMGDEARVDALISGAEDYVSKPFRPKELLARGHLHMQFGKKRAKLEKAYYEQQVEVTLLSDYCPSGIMRADGEGVITYVNSAWRQVANMDASEDPNTWPQLVDEDTQKRLFAEWIPFTTNNEQRELRINWKWQSTGRTVQGVFINLSMVHPGMQGILGCLTDITYEEQRLVEAEQRRLEAEESKHQQELLIDLTSHEIRTPVSAILQCSSLVKENLSALYGQLKWASDSGFKPSTQLLSDLEEDLEDLESIYQCGLVQERIAGDVLSLARIQLDMLTLYDVEMDLRKEARKVISVFSSEAKMKKIELATEFGETLEQAKIHFVKSDPVRLGQVVTNLMANAIRFTASSDVRKITVRYDVSFLPPPDDTCAVPSSIGLPAVLPAPEDTPIWLFISVRDTGPGLGPKELALLFKRFSQGNKMIHTRYGGSGLGLFICRKITELLHGRIEVKSQLGQGSVFRFFIKTSTAAPTSTVADRSATPDSIGSTSDIVTTSTPPPDDIQDLHILIVEDNIINQTVLKRQIIKAGLTCDVANNGLEAINLIREADRQSRRGGLGRKKAYNVVLMDLEMPVMDGLAAIKEIRASEAAGTLRRNMVIALTGNARQGQIDQALAAGMDDVVIKPYVLSNLLRKIKEMKQKADVESI